MKIRLLTGAVCAALFLLTAGCRQDGLNKTESGFAYKIVPSERPGDSIQYRDVVKVQLYQYVDDSLLSTTVGKMPQYVEINSELKAFDYTELLSKMRVNDSAACYFEIKDLIARADKNAPVPEVLKNHKQVRVFFRIMDKFSNEADVLFDREKTQQSLVGYSPVDEKTGFRLARQSFDSLIGSLPVKPARLDGGVYVLLKQKGTGKKIAKGQEVAVIYKGMLADGRVFEEKIPENPLVIHAGQGETSPGFDRGIASLDMGDKALIYIPAELAFGAQRAGDYIPAFSNLIFEVEIAEPNIKSK
jgi:FKBP-type peptidyl-prolyl cis-trans isomerase FkpA